MRKLFATAALVVAALFTTAAPVMAVSVTVAPAAPAAPANDSPYLNGYKWWTPSICMAVGDVYLEAPELAQEFNRVSGGILKIQAANNCVSAGYTPSRRFTIEAYNGSTTYCFKLTDKNSSSLDPGSDLVAVGGTWQFIDNPILYVNRECWATVANRRHWTSAGIASILGASQQYSEALNSRVVNHTAWSRRNIQYADVYTVAVLNRLYG